MSSQEHWKNDLVVFTTLYLVVLRCLAKGLAWKDSQRGGARFRSWTRTHSVLFAPSPRLFFSEGSKIRSWNIRFSFQIFVSLFIWSKTYIRGRTERGGHQKSIWLVNTVLSKIQIWFMEQNPEWHKLFPANSFYNNLVVRSWTNCFYVMWTSCYVNFYEADLWMTQALSNEFILQFGVRSLRVHSRKYFSTLNS